MMSDLTGRYCASVGLLRQIGKRKSESNTKSKRKTIDNQQKIANSTTKYNFWN